MLHRWRSIVALLLTLVAIGALIAGWPKYQAFKQRRLNTQIVEAAENGDAALVERLLKQGVSPNATKPMPDPIFSDDKNVYQESALMAALATKHPNVAVLLVEHGANVNLRDGHNGTLLILVALDGETDNVYFLLSKGAEVNAQDQYGYTALMLSSARGTQPHAKIVAALLQKGANINLKNENGSTALIYASSLAHPDIVRLLLEHGADVTIKDKHSMTALKWTIKRRTEDITYLRDKTRIADGRFRLRTLTDKKNCDKIIELLKQAGAKE